jgi:hypothetical protein
MGHCQGDPGNYGCEARVAAIIARENAAPLAAVGRRPWPATTTLPQVRCPLYTTHFRARWLSRRALSVG